MGRLKLGSVFVFVLQVGEGRPGEPGAVGKGWTAGFAGCGYR